MACGIWRGVDNVARKVTKQWRGVDGVARKIKTEWRGVDGVARKVFGSGFTIYDNGYNPYLFRAYGDGYLQFTTSNCLQLISGIDRNVSGGYPFRTQTKIPMSSLDPYSYLYIQYTGQITTSDRLYFVFRSGGDSLYADYIVGYYMTSAESWSVDYQSSLTTLKISIDKVWNARSNFINLYNQYGYPEVWYRHNQPETNDYGDFMYIKYKDLNIYKIWLE